MHLTYDEIVVLMFREVAMEITFILKIEKDQKFENCDQNKHNKLQHSLYIFTFLSGFSSKNRR